MKTNDLISLSHNKKAFCKGDFEEVLEGSLTFLDASCSAMDVVSQMKEAMLGLQSSLRRHNIDEGIYAYFASGKKIGKIVSKRLANLKKADKKNACLENDVFAIKTLKEAESVSLLTMKSALSFVIRKKALSHTHCWSMVAKLVNPKHTFGEVEAVGEVSEVEEVNHTLCSLSGKQLDVHPKAFLKQLEALEIVIHQLEDGLDLSFLGKGDKLLIEPVMFERQEEAGEVRKIEQALLALEAKKSMMDIIMGVEMKALLKQLEISEMIIHQLEDRLALVSRCLVKTRVSLLNVLY
ncbi:hypothetical protein Cgig2_011169 [Carnegiea gigantea]|uniref:Uncharacterized protein n=1 Tax=Carnegiea gigantea TaxID=171969 RepID=A0A9Q1GJL4_9CARY|nr:hypothetical protein Cgig2_011169 [Carnegiea gigantea]